MSENQGEADAIGTLISSLSSDDPVVRQTARDQLVDLGGTRSHVPWSVN